MVSIYKYILLVALQREKVVTIVTQSIRRRPTGLSRVTTREQGQALYLQSTARLRVRRTART